MLIRWTGKRILILVSTLLFACVCAAKTAGASTPRTEPNPSVTPTTSTSTSFQIDVPSGGAMRSAWIHVPAGYPFGGPVPLVLSFHGYSSNGQQQESMTGMSVLADSAGFLVAYPNALPPAPGQSSEWNAGPRSADVQFVRDLVKRLKHDYNVQPSRIYATGMSNGGGMANRVGCDLADIFAAIAPVEGGYAEPGWAVCCPSRSMPVMAFHGLSDQVVPFNGGKGTGFTASATFPAIPDWAGAWALRNSCNMLPVKTTTSVTQPTLIKVTRTKYGQCADNASVILYAIDPHYHTWPKGNPIDATPMIWAFFSMH
jgi:polyhydroxybutyrate depolymerase